MAIEELNDIAEEMADKLGYYNQERIEWTMEFKKRVRDAVKLEEVIRDKFSRISA